MCCSALNVPDPTLMFIRGLGPSIFLCFASAFLMNYYSKLMLVGIFAAEASEQLSLRPVLTFPSLRRGQVADRFYMDNIRMLDAHGWALMKPVRKSCDTALPLLPYPL
jgi:hypothetical protein